jgi:hypothetical protein
MTAPDASKAAGNGEKPSIGQLLFRGGGAELLNIRRELPADASAEDFRQALIARADREGVHLFGELAAYQEGVKEPELKLREVLHAVVDALLVGHEDMTVSEALQYVDKHGRWSELLLGFLDEVTAGGKASGVPDLVAGQSWVGRVPIGEGLKLPVMVAVATPFTPRKEWLDMVSFQFQRDFAPMAQMKPESLREGPEPCRVGWETARAAISPTISSRRKATETSWRGTILTGATPSWTRPTRRPSVRERSALESANSTSSRS